MIAPDGPEALRPHSLGTRGPTHKAAERERGNHQYTAPMATEDQIHEALVEIIRVGLVKLRNLGHGETAGTNPKQMLYWIDLLHSIPPLLHGPVHPNALHYLSDVHGTRFLSEYPSPSEVEYQQVKALLYELKNPVGREF